MTVEDLENWNPWWNTNKVPEILKGIEREIDPLIFKTLNEKEIIILTGIRRSGKTTIMYQMIEQLLKEHETSQIIYLNLDDEKLKIKTLEEIYDLYRQEKNPNKKAFIFLDEIQNKKEWEKFLKKYYDMRANVKFIISGSSASLLKQEYSTLLTGRNFTFKITPLTFKEYLKFSDIAINKIDSKNKNQIIHKLNQFLEIGGFPEAFFKEEELKKILLKEYFDDIIYKDIISRHNINAKKINDLATYLLTNITSPFTIRKLRNYTGLSIDSIKEYISYLEDSFMLKIITHFSYSLKEKDRLPKKPYCVDNGIRNVASFRFSKDFGRLAENLVWIELNRREKDIYYWKEKGEVDFVIKNKDNSLVAINVSYTNEINERETNALIEFKKKFNKTNELILITKDTEKTNDSIKYIPLWKWLLEEI
ncbi:ATP-binding protein [Candidatus Woesearchaeota archaeon]|jgi:uncharacterized protein|nr:ATP-binding protein [Candidatus Woesearchaeota archaeon]MBT6518548.1 ATP-binding protein [Candidatus Woesearchaeota archaeon]MBT7368420.1 ATP-binding protein [Candidatus Woesearchaeota archaeon]